MFIFWDHGAGPTEGVCFDEKYDYDSLTLPELSSAFENAGLSYSKLLGILIENAVK